VRVVSLLHEEDSLRDEPDWKSRLHPGWRVWSARHFRLRLAERMVSREEVRDTLAAPDLTFPSKGRGRVHIQRTFGSRKVDLIVHEDGPGKTLVCVTVIVHKREARP